MVERLVVTLLVNLSTSGKIEQIYLIIWYQKNDATYKLIYWVGVFQGNKFNLTTANVMTPYDFFRSEKKPEKKLQYNFLSALVLCRTKLV